MIVSTSTRKFFADCCCIIHLGIFIGFPLQRVKIRDQRVRMRPPLEQKYIGATVGFTFHVAHYLAWSSNQHTARRTSSTRFQSGPMWDSAMLLLLNKEATEETPQLHLFWVAKCERIRMFWLNVWNDPGNLHRGTAFVFVSRRVSTSETNLIFGWLGWLVS